MYTYICVYVYNISVIYMQVCVSRSVVSHSLRPPGLQPTRLLCPWNSAQKNTVVGSDSLLQGIFLTQGLNSGLLHCRQILYPLSYLGCPIETYISVITLNINGLNTPIKRINWLNGYQNKTNIYAVYKRST